MTESTKRQDNPTFPSLLFCFSASPRLRVSIPSYTRPDMLLSPIGSRLAKASP